MLTRRRLGHPILLGTWSAGSEPALALLTCASISSNRAVPSITQEEAKTGGGWIAPRRWPALSDSGPTSVEKPNPPQKENGDPRQMRGRRSQEAVRSEETPTAVNVVAMGGDRSIPHVQMPADQARITRQMAIPPNGIFDEASRFRRHLILTMVVMGGLTMRVDHANVHPPRPDARGSE